MIHEIKHLVPSLIFACFVALAISTGTQAVGITPIPDIDTPKTSLGGAVKASQKINSGNSDKAPKLASESSGAKEYKDGTYYGSAKGYNGNITVKLVIKAKKIASIKIVSHTEDKPYLDKAIKLIKSILKTQSTNVDAVSGATYSSNGIIMAVRDALKKAVLGKANKAAPQTKEPNKPNKKAPSLPPESTDERKYKDGVYRGSGKGFNGDIVVDVTIDSGNIAAIKIVSHTEDAPYLQSARNVIASILNAQNTNVDAVAGATYSSHGIIKAVRDALNKAVVNEDEQEEFEIPNPDAGYEALYGQYKDGEYTGKAAGYEGYIYVKVTIEAASIKNIEVTRQVEEKAYWNACYKLLDRVLYRQTVDGIDTVTGATYTSRGLLGAVAEALAKAKIA